MEYLAVSGKDWVQKISFLTHREVVNCNAAATLHVSLAVCQWLPRFGPRGLPTSSYMLGRAYSGPVKKVLVR